MARAEAARAAIASCLRGQPGGEAIALTVTVDAAGVVQRVKLAPPERPAGVQACVIAAMQAVSFSAAAKPREGILAFAGEVAPLRKVAAPGRTRASASEKRPATNGDEKL